SGTVVRGNHIGEKIGYPTANIVPDSDKVLPPNGVYVVDARMISDDSDTKKEDSYTGIADLGVKPTISDDNPVCLEVNLFDGSHDLYDKCLEVDILKFIRPEMRFDNTDELTKQIENDIKTAKEWLEYEQIDNT
ncbi:MAG: riboflavin kinase, partial [Eubacterium sp.]|nr:riboflavin kinase [Eubacterium sp.]